MDEVRGSTPLDSTSRFRSFAKLRADRHRFVWLVFGQAARNHHVAVFIPAAHRVGALWAFALGFKPHAHLPDCVAADRIPYARHGRTP